MRLLHERNKYIADAGFGCQLHEKLDSDVTARRRYPSLASDRGTGFTFIARLL